MKNLNFLQSVSVTRASNTARFPYIRSPLWPQKALYSAYLKACKCAGVIWRQQAVGNRRLWHAVPGFGSLQFAGSPHIVASYCQVLTLAGKMQVCPEFGEGARVYKIRTKRRHLFGLGRLFFFSLLIERAIFNFPLACERMCSNWPERILNDVSASLCDMVQNQSSILCIFIVMKIFYDSI